MLVLNIMSLYFINWSRYFLPQPQRVGGWMRPADSGVSLKSSPGQVEEKFSFQLRLNCYSDRIQSQRPPIQYVCTSILNQTITLVKVLKQTSKTLFKSLTQLLSSATLVHVLLSVFVHHHCVDEAYFNTISWQPVGCCGWLSSPLNSPDWLMSDWIFGG